MIPVLGHISAFTKELSVESATYEGQTVPALCMILITNVTTEKRWSHKEGLAPALEHHVDTHKSSSERL